MYIEDRLTDNRRPTDH